MNDRQNELTNQDKRCSNLRYAHENVSKCDRKIRINNYLPGQVIYHLGEYPHKVSIKPSQYDKDLIKKMSDAGFELIQIHTDWTDELRLYGADKFSSYDPEGLKEFVELCHENKIKILAYCSSTFIHAYDEDFKEEFTRMETFLRGIHMNLRVCWSGSGAWREFIWKKTFDLLDEYGFDGIYNDMGHDAFLKQYFDEIEKNGEYSGDIKELPYEVEVEDLLSMFYNELHRRGKLYKLHIGTYLAPNTDENVYDYLYVGEGVRSVKDIIKECKDKKPFLVPAFDRRTVEIEDADLPYVCTIPFLQFPLLYHGRPITKYGKVEGVTYYDTAEFDGKMTNHNEEAVKHLEKHPDEPTYSEWSSIPDDVTEFDRCAKYLKLYKPMVTDGSVARINIKECSFIKSPMCDDVYFSLFTNEEQYLVVSNLTNFDYTLVLDGSWKNRETGEICETFVVPKNKIIFLMKI